MYKSRRIPRLFLQIYQAISVFVLVELFPCLPIIYSLIHRLHDIVVTCTGFKSSFMTYENLQRHLSFIIKKPRNMKNPIALHS